MASEDLFKLFGLIDIQPDRPVNFLLTDNESMTAKVRLLASAAKYFNVGAVTEYGGRSGTVRQEGLVEQIIGAAFQTFGGHDPHPDPFDKAAMLLRGVTQGHPFTDGNKRTGFLIAVYYLMVMGYPIPVQADRDAVIEFCVSVSAGSIRDLDEIADHLRSFWE